MEIHLSRWDSPILPQRLIIDVIHMSDDSKMGKNDHSVITLSHPLQRASITKTYCISPCSQQRVMPALLLWMTHLTPSRGHSVRITKPGRIAACIHVYGNK